MMNNRWKVFLSLATLTFLGLQLCTGPMILNVGKQGKQLYEQEKYDQAIAELKSTIEEHPKKAELRYYLGLAYLQKHDLDPALAAYENALGIKENPTMDSMYSSIMAERAAELRKAERYDEVPKWADQAIELDKKNKKAYYEKYMAKGLRLYYEGSKWELWDAIVAFGNASTAKPDEPMPYYYSAKSYLKKDEKDFENSIEQYNKALEHNPPREITSEIRSKLKDLKRRKKLYEDFWGN